MIMNSKVTITILLACLTVTAGLAMDQPPTSEEQEDPTQQAGPKHDIDEPPGAGDWFPTFLIVYLRKDGDWGKDDCITVFPETAEVSLTKKPKKIRWVVLDKEEGHEWEIMPKTAGDDSVPPLDKKIPKAKGKNAFKSGPPKDKGVSVYDWDYKVQVREVDADGNPTGNSCILDPGVRVRG
jgi:hypothetical protein